MSSSLLRANCMSSLNGFLFNKFDVIYKLSPLLSFVISEISRKHDRNKLRNRPNIFVRSLSFFLNNQSKR